MRSSDIRRAQRARRHLPVGTDRGFYGIEATFRDNSGSWFSMTQRTEARVGSVMHSALSNLANFLPRASSRPAFEAAAAVQLNVRR